MKKLREAFSHIIYNCNHEIKAILHDSGALLILFLADIIEIPFIVEINIDSSIAIILLIESLKSPSLIEMGFQFPLKYLKTPLTAEPIRISGKFLT